MDSLLMQGWPVWRLLLWVVCAFFCRSVYTLSWLTADGSGLVGVCLTTCLEYEDGV